MSHFTKCEMKMVNLEAIKLALKDLDFQFTEAEENQVVNVRGWRGQELGGKLSINMGKYDVGVVQNADGTFDLVADWWGVETTKGLSETEIKNKLGQRYQYHNVKMACEAKGYSVEEEVNEEDGSIQLVVRKWVND
jgi:hypothetical protein